MRSTRLGSDGPDILPISSEQWDSILLSDVLVDEVLEDHFILHGRREARALQCSTPKSLPQHRSNINLNLLSGTTIETIPKVVKHLNGAIVEQVTVLNGDEVDHVPRILHLVSVKKIKL